LVFCRLQQNFPVEGPRLILGTVNPTTADVVLAERLRYFYAAEQRLEAARDAQLVGLLTDSLVQAGIRELVDILFLRGEAPVYQYIFSYVGSLSNTQQWFGVSRPDLGEQMVCFLKILLVKAAL
jgi:hypothetical protein